MTLAGRGAYWLPRGLHPMAWWLWALCLAAAAGRTSNPVLLVMVCLVASWVVVARRSDAPWAKAFHYYLIAGAVVIALRLMFRVVFADVAASSLLSAAYDGLRLATVVVCLGAANALANPRRLLRSLPPALFQVTAAIVVALSVFPQLAESVQRVHRARRLRAGVRAGKIAGLRSVVVPVLEDALDRSLLLAASMDARGQGRRAGRSAAQVRTTGTLLVGGLLGCCVGVYGLLDATTPAYLGLPMLVGGALAGVAGIGLSGRSVQRSAYRPDRWRLAEVVTVASGVVAVAAVWTANPWVLQPVVSPPAWPLVEGLPLVGLLVALLPAVLTPLPEVPLVRRAAAEVPA